jgi:tetratricopeptide (TPR) repeat protein
LRRYSSPWLGLACILALCWLAYLPGLKGGFLFDDFVNLDALGATGPVSDWATFWRYLTSGTADPIGRPLSLLSFLLDARDWPADAAPFLRTNLLLHLVNGVLLFALLSKLERMLGSDGRHAGRIASVAAGLWLLHPLLVSTTLYIVQREAMLPATFTLLGLIAWCHGRGSPPGAKATMWMAGGMLGFGTLAVLSKANGVLLPLLALVLEFTVLRATGSGEDRRGRHLRLVLLGLPTVLLLAYLATRLPQLHDVPSGREWSIGQRLLTEPRVLLDYLRLLAIPSSASTGIYNDSYAASTGLFAPWTTLPCLFLVVALVSGGVFLRHRAPRASAALLFFFAGHLLESTIIPLELYFEHRNYLPAMLAFWPLAHILRRDGAPAWAGAACAGLLVLVAYTTWQRAILWGQPGVQASLWAQANPGSPRAQATLAMHLVAAGRPREALSRLDPLWRAAPQDLQFAFNYVDASCRGGALTAGDAARVESAIAAANRANSLVARWISKAIGVANGRTCAGLDLAVLSRWIEAADANPAFDPDEAGPLVSSLRAQLALAAGDGDLASRQFADVLRQSPLPDTAARNTAMLASAGHYRLALAHLDAFEDMAASPPLTAPGMPRIHAWVLRRQGYWERELAGLREKLVQEITRAPAEAEGKGS